MTPPNSSFSSLTLYLPPSFPHLPPYSPPSLRSFVCLSLFPFLFSSFPLSLRASLSQIIPFLPASLPPSPLSIPPLSPALPLSIPSSFPLLPSSVPPARPPALALRHAPRSSSPPLSSLPLASLPFPHLTPCLHSPSSSSLLASPPSFFDFAGIAGGG